MKGTSSVLVISSLLELWFHRSVHFGLIEIYTYDLCPSLVCVYTYICKWQCVIPYLVLKVKNKTETYLCSHQNRTVFIHFWYMINIR